jgi:hypothetical protein
VLARKGLACVSTSTPSCCAKAISQGAPMLGQDVAVDVPELVQQPRRALDVCEEEGDRSRREIALHWTT